MTSETRRGIPLDAIGTMSDIQATHIGTHLTEAELAAASDLYDSGIGVMVTVGGEKLGFRLRAPVAVEPEPTVGEESPAAENLQSPQG